VNERDARMGVIQDLGGKNPNTATVLLVLMNEEEWDILNHLYKYGPKGDALWELYDHHCFRDHDLFMIDMRVRLETGL
jgi:hypothetical protein